MLKLNDQELALLSPMFNLEGTVRQQVEDLARHFDLTLVALDAGSRRKLDLSGRLLDRTRRLQCEGLRYGRCRGRIHGRAGRWPVVRVACGPDQRAGQPGRRVRVLATGCDAATARVYLARTAAGIQSIQIPEPNHAVTASRKERVPLCGERQRPDRAVVGPESALRRECGQIPESPRTPDRQRRPM